MEDAAVEIKIETPFDFTKSRNQMLIIQGVRLAFQFVILIITLAFQSAQPEFVNVDVLFPVYILLATSFAVNGLYLFFFDRALRSWPATAFLFTFDAIFVTALIYSTGVSQSIFLFMYLVNIILCGFVFQRTGATALSLWTSVLFSFLMIMQNEIKGQTLYFAFGLNLLAFFAIAGLSGFLSEQLNFMGSELKARGKDLAKLKDLNNLIVENIATGLVTVSQSGNIVQCNHAASEILDRQIKLLGMEIQKILPGFLTRVSRLIQSEGKTAHFEIQYVNKRDEKLILEMIVSPLRNTNNDLEGYILIFQDLTKVRRLEFAMRQSEKLAAVGQLAAGIAHEIRNPLASISGSIQMLKATAAAFDPSGDQARLMSIILREIDRLNALISEFLEFVRPEVPATNSLQINDIVREVADMARVNQALRSDVQQHLDLRAKQKISGHFDKLKQALLNMVINAYQAMEKATNPELVLSTKDRDQYVLLKIRDNGSGIEEKNLKRIFEPFHTTKPKGTGLGLAVTHKILESHGAKVFVESSPGQGTEFTLEFPAEKAATSTQYDQVPLRKANE